MGSVLRSVMIRFVKKSEIEGVKQPADLVKIDLANSKCTYKEIAFGVAARRALADSKLSDAQKMAFQMQCIDFWQQWQ